MRDLYEDFLTAEQVAEFLGISVKTLKNRVSARKDHPPIIRGTGKFRRDAFMEWIKKMEVSQLNKVKSL